MPYETPDGRFPVNRLTQYYKPVNRIEKYDMEEEEYHFGPKSDIPEFKTPEFKTPEEKNQAVQILFGCIFVIFGFGFWPVVIWIMWKYMT
jgi:hypothetical protein